MGFYDSDIYSQPEKFGLELVGMLDEARCYEFNMFGVWRNIETGQLYYAQDMGCSCPSPFEDYNAVDDLAQSDKAGVMAAIDEWVNYSYVSAFDVMDLKQKIENL